MDFHSSNHKTWNLYFYLQKKSRDYTFSASSRFIIDQTSEEAEPFILKTLSTNSIQKNSNLLPHTVQQTQLHRFSSLLKSSVLHAHKPNCIQRPLIWNHLGPIHPVPPQNLALMLTRSTDLWFWILLYFSFIQCSVKANAIPWLSYWRSGKSITSQKWCQSADLLSCLHIF